MKKSFLAVLLTGVLAMLAGAAQAATFGIKVVTENGEPVAGAAVCIGTHGNYRQFAAEFTSSDGSVSVDVPNVALVVTVSKNRFSGLRITEPARQYNLVKEIKLIEGMPGPRCRARSSVAVHQPQPDPRSLVVNDVQVQTVESNGSALSLALMPNVSGEPSHYRISDSVAIMDANWRRYTPAISLPAELQHSDSVYLQVRRFKSRASGWIETRSHVVTVPLPRT